MPDQDQPEDEKESNQAEVAETEKPVEPDWFESSETSIQSRMEKVSSTRRWKASTDKNNAE